MGFEINRFSGDVDDELLCPICSGVLDEPLQAPACEHAFCSACIHQWISRQPTCPVDRQSINELRPVPRILRNLLSRLSITCDNSTNGCTSVVKLHALSKHLAECEHNPKKAVPCGQHCEQIPKDELEDHNYARELGALINQQHLKIQDFQQKIADYHFEINEQEQELYILKNFILAIRTSNPGVPAADGTDMEEAIRRSSSLDRARVTHWVGIIPTPNMLQIIHSGWISSLTSHWKLNLSPFLVFCLLYI